MASRPVANLSRQALSGLLILGILLDPVALARSEETPFFSISAHVVCGQALSPVASWFARFRLIGRRDRQAKRVRSMALDHDEEMRPRVADFRKVTPNIVAAPQSLLWETLGLRGSPSAWDEIKPHYEMRRRSWRLYFYRWYADRVQERYAPYDELLDGENTIFTKQELIYAVHKAVKAQGGLRISVSDDALPMEGVELYLRQEKRWFAWRAWLPEVAKVTQGIALLEYLLQRPKAMSHGAGEEPLVRGFWWAEVLSREPFGLHVNIRFRPDRPPTGQRSPPPFQKPRYGRNRRRHGLTVIPGSATHLRSTLMAGFYLFGLAFTPLRILNSQEDGKLTSRISDTLKQNSVLVQFNLDRFDVEGRTKAAMRRWGILPEADRAKALEADRLQFIVKTEANVSRNALRGMHIILRDQNLSVVYELYLLKNTNGIWEERQFAPRRLLGATVSEGSDGLLVEFPMPAERPVGLAELTELTVKTGQQSLGTRLNPVSVPVSVLFRAIRSVPVVPIVPRDTIPAVIQTAA